MKSILKYSDHADRHSEFSITTLLKPIGTALLRVAIRVGIFIIEYRNAQARAFLRDRLPQMSDSELRNLGITREQIPEYIKSRLS